MVDPGFSRRGARTYYLAGIFDQSRLLDHMAWLNCLKRVSFLGLSVSCNYGFFTGGANSKLVCNTWEAGHEQVQGCRLH